MADYKSKIDSFVLDDKVAIHMRENLQPLYDSLTSYKENINKAEIINTLNLDSGDLLKKLNRRIDEERESIEQFNRQLERRVLEAFQKDKKLKNDLEEYKDEIITYLSDEYYIK